MGFFLVLKAELVRSFIIMRRYWFATVTGLIVSYGFFVGLIFAFVQSPENLADWAPAIFDKIVGFLIGMFAMGVVGLFTQRLQAMARTGELEQVCMSPHGLVTNFLARSFVASMMSILTSSILLAMLTVSLGGEVHPNPVSTVVLMILTYVSLIGFGFMVGGLVLVFKQTGQLAMLLRMGLLLLAMFATEQIVEYAWPIRFAAHCLPVTDAAICLKYVLLQGEPNGPVFQHPSFYALLINCAVWTAVGITCFRYLENWSRDKGTLGAY